MEVHKFKLLLVSLIASAQLIGYAQQIILPQQTSRWSIQADGSINWIIKNNLPHNDHIEMSGEKVSLWVGYTIEKEGTSKIIRTLVFPTYRMLPDDTRSHISYTFYDNQLPRFYIDNKLMNIGTFSKEDDSNMAFRVTSINQHGIMRIAAEMGSPALVKIERSLFPSVDKPLAIEKFKITNITKNAFSVSMEKFKREETTDALKSKVAPHTVIMQSINDGSIILQPGMSTSFSICYSATDHPEALVKIYPEEEEAARIKRVEEIEKQLQLQTPDTILNTAFAFAKIRATESIFKTKRGYLHSPGGLQYYAAIWANDQAEYVSPYFAFSGDSIANLSAMNCYRFFAGYINPAYDPIPSSIVAEGDTTWAGAGDRGDQAMIAYGAARYVLTYGNIDSAKALWPLITWCLEYNRRHLNKQGVVASESDELEGRFPSGKANLSTNCLYYDALVSSALLAKQLKLSKAQIDVYTKQAATLKANIAIYFNATIEGFETYKYYETNTLLRSWICIPLTMGILERSKGTIDALFSPQLWTVDGLATQEGESTFWDRSTLYALRGVLQAGTTEKALIFLQYYSKRRLLGEHVPYPVEAYPEGNQRHLSAESGLYCRIFTEGLFGMRPTGFRSFTCTPRLPKNWNEMALNNIHSFGSVFNLKILRQANDKINIIIFKDNQQKIYSIKDGQSLEVKF